MKTFAGKVEIFAIQENYKFLFYRQATFLSLLRNEKRGSDNIHLNVQKIYLFGGYLKMYFFYVHGRLLHSIQTKLPIKFSNPKEANSSAMGSVFKPIFVRRYSTLGGISGYDFLATSLFSTKKFNS